MAKRIRARGMNAALASGEAGVGEMNPARSPMRPRQFGVALAAAVVGGGLGMFTYHAVAHTQSSYSGQVAPAQTYYLDFAADGTVLTLDVQPGTHVTKGQVLATQNSGVAQADLSAAQAAVTADQAVVAADAAPQTGAGAQAAAELSVTQANAAVSAAQSALGLQQNSAQHTISAQTALVGSAQNAYSTDSAHYASDCTDTADTASSGAAAAAHASPAGSASPAAAGNATSAASAGAAESAASGAADPSDAAAPGPASTGSTGSVTQEQFCQNLQSTVNRDYTALSAAQAQLAGLQSSTQAQAQRDESDLGQSQAVLTAAQTRQSAASAPLTPAVIAQAKSALATAQAQVAADQQALQNTKIVAPAAGTVADTAGAAGDVVGPDGVHGYQGPAEQSGTQANQQPGFELFAPQSSDGNGTGTSQASYMPLITLYTGPLTVVAQIPETDMSSVHVGDPATVDISALGLSVPGTVRGTALDPVRGSSSTTYYDVTLSLSSTDTRIMAGMSVQIDLH
jgi:multidrug efflux pump subunit AcrA (membrane-fusion protein)